MMKRLFLFLFLVLAVCPAFAQVSPQTNSQFMATPSSGSGYLGLRPITPLDFNNGTGASGSTCLSGILTWVACNNASTLTGATLNSSVVNSSLTSLGTLTSLNVAGSITTSSITTNVNASGTYSADLYLNPTTISVGAIIDAGHNVYGNGTQCNFTSTAFSTQFFCGYDYLYVTAGSVNDFPNNIYVGRFIYAFNTANFTSANSSVTGINSNCLNKGTGLVSLVCDEIDVTTTQAISGEKLGLKIVQASVDAYHGGTVDAAFYVTNQTGAIGWNDILNISANGAASSTTSNIINSPNFTLKMDGSIQTAATATYKLGTTYVPLGALGAINGEFATVGAAGGFLIGDRAGTGSGWLWYATGGTAMLLDLTYGTNVLTINSANNVTFTAQTLFSASLATNAAINIPQGTAPTTPNNGDVWMTSSGLYYRFNGTTHGPL